VTSRTISNEDTEYRGIHFDFRPAAIYAYTLGANILRHFNSGHAMSQGGSKDV